MTFPPGPRLPPLMVTAAPYGWMRRLWRRHGDVFSSNFPYYGRVVYVADPAEVKRVFTGDPTILHAGEANALALGDVLGDHSLLTLDEERHLSQRKLLLPPFHGESVRRYTEVMAEATAREVARWPLRRAVPVRPRMQAITLEVILRAVFGVREGERMGRFREWIPRLAEAASVMAGSRACEVTSAASPPSQVPAHPRGGELADLRGDPRPPGLHGGRRARRRALPPYERAPRGRQAHERRRAPRRAHDAAYRRPRDHRHRAVPGLRAPGPYAAGAGAAARFPG